MSLRPTLNSAKVLLWVDRLIWSLIYGGLFSVVIGLATLSRDEVLAWSLMAVGGSLAAIGVVLVWFRSRLRENG